MVGAAHESRATLTENEISKAKAVASKIWSPVESRGITVADPVRSFPVCSLVNQGYRAVKNGVAPDNEGVSLDLLRQCRRGWNLFQPRGLLCMTKTPEVASPILAQTSPDRPVNCEVALEAAFAALVATSIAQGWTPEETADTLHKLAVEHLEQLKATTA
ncbi:hypothetical protein [Mesorhizobium sp. CO1-1-8]|uniref:hypothetical protein n=1 Tax=Mesorhizobium sp. CO1-1-8 TaxID=2876631 RepID=UPI001CD07B3C|nr:hypothetical protein [Mesorhizobium sp. CO1-1-8]MBZ9773970.1 hypothetical protein [Mesorhizobium sp. CO1-1-8]